MRDLESLSPIGFGAYRADRRSSIHRAALHRALDAGCNLVDTASNYADGNSEELIGSVLAERDDLRPFVITKAGYVSPALATQFETAGVARSTDDDGAGTVYRIDPDALRVSLDVSRSRLRTQCLDAVLVHNPEILLGRGWTHAAVYAELARAFSFLEDEVARGRLRYYGLSSTRALDVGRVVAAAAEATQDNHFEILQFPLNMMEREAAEDSSNLVDEARRLGLRSISNRPLNALSAGAPVRLAYYPSARSDAAEAVFARCVEAVDARLRDIGSDSTASDFAPMRFLRDNRDGMADPDLVDVIWNNQVLPFVSVLFDDALTGDVVELFDELQTVTRAVAQSGLSAATDRALADLDRDVVRDCVSSDTLAERAIRYCLDAGVDHVLVGMRHPAYVDSLRGLLRSQVDRGAFAGASGTSLHRSQETS